MLYNSAGNSLIKNGFVVSHFLIFLKLTTLLFTKNKNSKAYCFLYYILLLIDLNYKAAFLIKY